MKLLYEESPKRFEELLATLLKTDSDLIVGPKFSQQMKRQHSIPDLEIIQKSFSIFFETKLENWFYEEQIERHIKSFNPTASNKILFLLSNFDQGNSEEQFRKQIQTAKDNQIVLQPLSFEDLIGSLEQVCNSEYLKNILEEFKVYLDQNGLLPKWKYLLDVVNCKGTMHEIAENVYMCPDTGGAYSHRRAKFFGPYANKSVNRIFHIKAIVVIDTNLSGSKVKWKDSDESDQLLIDQALAKLNLWDWRIEENRSTPLQVFLLDDDAQTDFRKITSGGMQQSKKYFWDIAIDCNNSTELAEKLSGHSWNNF